MQSTTKIVQLFEKREFERILEILREFIFRYYFIRFDLYRLNNVSVVDTQTHIYKNSNVTSSD